MKRKSPTGGPCHDPRALAAALFASLALGACAAPSQPGECVGFGSCEAVTDLDARLMRAPICVRIEEEPEDPCSCEGAVTLTNECDYEVIAKNFVFEGSETVLFPGESATFEVVPGEGVAVLGGERQYELVADGSDFEVVVDYQLTEKGDESSCSTLGAGRGGSAAGSWLGLGVLGLYVARRRRRPW